MGRRGAEVGENLERAVLEIGRRTWWVGAKRPRPRCRRAALLDGFALIRIALKHAESRCLVVERTRVGLSGFGFAVSRKKTVSLLPSSGPDSAPRIQHDPFCRTMVAKYFPSSNRRVCSRSN